MNAIERTFPRLSRTADRAFQGAGIAVTTVVVLAAMLFVVGGIVGLIVFGWRALVG